MKTDQGAKLVNPPFARQFESSFDPHNRRPSRAKHKLSVGPEEKMTKVM
jgi:hypothetical protein